LAQDDDGTGRVKVPRLPFGRLRGAGSTVSFYLYFVFRSANEKNEIQNEAKAPL
jgi:hypothetical protein